MTQCPFESLLNEDYDKSTKNQHEVTFTCFDNKVINTLINQ